MSEYIKTGSAIHSAVVMDSHYKRVGEKHKKWVSIKWLKEQIQKSRGHTRMEDGLTKLESLIEQEENHSLEG